MDVVPFEQLSLSNETKPIYEAPDVLNVPKRASKKSPIPLTAFDPPPAYPPGPALHYRQSNRGLYGGGKILFGNMVSEKNEIKTRRKWRLNVKHKRLRSEALGIDLKIRLTTRVLRTINKAGGLDEYLLGEKAARIKELGMEGWKLRWMIMQTDSVKERYQKQMVNMGLAEEPPKESRVRPGERSLFLGKKKHVAGLLTEKIEAFDEVKFLGSEINLIGDGRPEKERETEKEQEKE